jgi:hypothetical protein
LFWGLAVVLLAPAGCLDADDEVDSRQKYEFCSGIVVEISSDRITVRRAHAGRPAEDRKFVITPETKVEGTLKLDARVTVGFVQGEGLEVAKRILVRPTRGH